MKLFRFRDGGSVKPGICIENKQYDASSVIADYNEAFFEGNWQAALANLNTGLPQVTISNKQFDAPVARPSKI
ncbi:MAG: ureidoglycolate lyase, partial [Sphingobacteriales bacterium]